MRIWPWQGVRLRKNASTCFCFFRFFCTFKRGKQTQSFPSLSQCSSHSQHSRSKLQRTKISHANHTKIFPLGILWIQVIKTSWSFCVTPFQSGWNRYCWYSSSELMALMCARADMRLHRYSGTADYLGLKILFFFLKEKSPNSSLGSHFL